MNGDAIFTLALAYFFITATAVRAFMYRGFDFDEIVALALLWPLTLVVLFSRGVRKLCARRHADPSMPEAKATEWRPLR